MLDECAQWTYGYYYFDRHWLEHNGHYWAQLEGGYCRYAYNIRNYACVSSITIICMEKSTHMCMRFTIVYCKSHDECQ